MSEHTIQMSESVYDKNEFLVLIKSILLVNGVTEQCGIKVFIPFEEETVLII
ncbi:hypothetical protein KCTCHS21_40000 [Cohnella abietis]|uniref:Uncharacterized protein n=2 Tax=Cohnella abietis TaxID=2507935 RepID=A0A3T1D915_9BACL|nr:hypothetical protein KCTCHS21_40000 [Cohnella abietis]